MIVRSSYTFGKSIKGKAIVKLTSENGVDAELTFNMNGKHSAEFAIGSDVNHYFDGDGSLTCQLHAIVFDELTGRNASKEKDIVFHRNRYKISADPSTYEYKRGKPVNLNVAIAYHDDTPLEINEHNKYIYIGKRLQWNRRVNYNRYKLDDEGKAKVRLSTDLGVSRFEVYVKYLDEDKLFGPYTEINENKVKEKISVKVLTKKCEREPIHSDGSCLTILRFQAHCQ